MRLIATPAQITTIEDRIAGNLNLIQLILISAPLFVSAVIFFALPPLSKIVFYKFAIAFVLTSICSLMALRINGELMLRYLQTRISYELRPRVYVYRKQIKIEPANTQEISADKEAAIRLNKQINLLSSQERLQAGNLLNDYHYLVSFKPVKTGGLNVKVNQA